MQKASKKTRSYFANANGLKGFLAPSIIKFIKEGMEEIQFPKVTDAVLKSLGQMQSNTERTDYLSTHNP